MIKSTIGKNCINNPSDVIVVKKLLNRCNISERFMLNQLKVNGQCNQYLMDAINTFQVSIMKGKAYGVIRPGRSTIKKIIELFLSSHNNDSLFWPLEKNIIRRNKINHTFGMVRTYENGKPKPHQGWDFEAKAGVTHAYAIANGMIIKIRNYGDYGLRITLGFNFKGCVYYAFYAHMQSSSVKQGDLVFQGDIIGLCGKSGNASELKAVKDEHLHFEIRTKPSVGLKLEYRQSPIKLFGKCPLKAPIFQRHDLIEESEKYAYVA